MPKTIIFLSILFVLAAGSVFAIELSVPIPCQDTTLTGQCAGGAGTNISDPATYVARIYQFGLLAAGITALGALVFGATKYILSAGNIFDQGEAKSQMLSAIYGLLLLLGAYLILNTINPDLVRLKNPDITRIFQATGKDCVTTDGLPGTFQKINNKDVCVASGKREETKISGTIKTRLDPSYRLVSNNFSAAQSECVKYKGIARQVDGQYRCNYCPSKRYELIPDTSGNGKDICQIKTIGAPPCSPSYPILVLDEFNKEICVAAE